MNFILYNNMILYIHQKNSLWLVSGSKEGIDYVLGIARINERRN